MLLCCLDPPEKRVKRVREGKKGECLHFLRRLAPSRRCSTQGRGGGGQASKGERCTGHRATFWHLIGWIWSIVSKVIRSFTGAIKNRLFFSRQKKKKYVGEEERQKNTYTRKNKVGGFHNEEKLSDTLPSV